MKPHKDGWCKGGLRVPMIENPSQLVRGRALLKVISCIITWVSAHFKKGTLVLQCGEYQQLECPLSVHCA